jgi:monoamine oxidase
MRAHYREGLREVKRLPGASKEVIRERTPPSLQVGAKRRNRKHVIIVGGGFAGMCAAYELNHLGYRVTVVEAREWIGGRVHSVGDFIADKNVEGGAELIGSNHYAWDAYSKKFGLKFLNVSDEGDGPAILGGKRLNAREQKKLAKDFHEATKVMAHLAETVDENEPWNNPQFRCYDRISLKDWVESQKFTPLAKLGLIEQMQADNGVIASKQSLLGNLLMVKGGGGMHFWTETEVFRCKGGNQQLAMKFEERLPKGCVIKGIRATHIHTGRRARVKLSDGRTLRGDDVVLAVPPSVWKRIKFKPLRPKALRIQMGHNIKFLMSFHDEFWNRAKISADYSSDGPIDMTWQGTEGQRGPGRAMVVFSGADNADIIRSWGPVRRCQKVVSKLGKVYKTLDKNLIGSRFFDWPSEPWTRASYAFPACGEINRVGKLLKEGIGSLHFAGEHTCYAFIGYMEGALQSGIQTAKKLARRDGVLP